MAPSEPRTGRAESAPAPPARPPAAAAARPAAPAPRQSPGPGSAMMRQPPPRASTRQPPASAAPSTPPALDAEGLPAFCGGALPDAEAARHLAVLNDGFVRECTRCRLHSGRKQTVFGVGCARPELVFVGEGPGADEDRLGEPFVGKAGQLLTRMIAAMTLTRDQVYIANVVKCRPPDNRTPLPDEMAACALFLFRQLAILRPRVIVTLGVPASQTLLATKTGINRLRGQFYDFPPPALQGMGLPTARLMPTFHPSYLLRCPWDKGKTWDDLQQVMQLLGIPIPQRSATGGTADAGPEPS
ncbi:MAG: uracil-DNA glycosylase [Planctomycetes bacterium]|nr:uracil-DNA glycosylase [Planctomycetota bacterium]